MNDFLKFLALAIPFLGFFTVVGIQNHDEPIKESFDGWVYHIVWKSRNHGMPLIEIKRKNGTIKKFHNSRIILNDSQLKVGDRFIKESDTKYCQVNRERVFCLI